MLISGLPITDSLKEGLVPLVTWFLKVMVRVFIRQLKKVGLRKRADHR